MSALPNAEHSEPVPASRRAPRLLILDDEHDVLELYREMLARLPSKPEIHTASSGARALALLDSEPFSLLLMDLRMPNMDGFQVLAVVRRKLPGLRVVVMTAATDEQFRARAYGMGVDLYMEKPKSAQELKLFIECIESMLERGEQAGFRGLQSKTLVDIIQLECLSLNSSVLKITNGGLVGHIWVNKGEIIDAETHGMSGREAFREIFAWRAGNFEILPAAPERTRTIFDSYENLLLETAQSLDEAIGSGAPVTMADGTLVPVSTLASFARFDGVEYLLSIEDGKFEHWGAENAEQLATWVWETMRRFQALGDKLHAGDLSQLEATGPHGHMIVNQHRNRQLCIGFTRKASDEQRRESTKQILARWVS